jgi:hypothetical protein
MDAWMACMGRWAAPRKNRRSARQSCIEYKQNLTRAGWRSHCSTARLVFNIH